MNHDALQTTEELRREVEALRRKVAELEGALGRRADEQLRLERARQHQAALVQLARNEAVNSGDLGRAACAITEAVAQAMEVERVGVWLLSADRRQLQCEDLYERGRAAHSRGAVLQAGEYPRYFEALESGRTIDAHSAATDPRTREFAQSYLAPLGISSMLDSGIRVRGQIVGVLCHEHVGEPRAWQAEELALAGAAADQVAQALLIAERKGAEQALVRERLLLRTLIDSLPDTIYAKDREARKTLANRADLDLIGAQNEADVLGKTDSEVFPPDIAAQFMADDQAVLQTGRSVINREELVVTGKGERRWLLTSKLPVRDQAGQITGMIGIGRDVTDRKQAREALQESRRMLQLVLDTIPVRVFWKDRDSVYLGCNHLCAVDAGLSCPEEIVGKNDFELSWNEQAERYRADDRLVMETGQPKVGYEEPQTRPDGSRIWLRTDKVPLRDEQGLVIGVLGTYEDITERKRVEEALREQNAFREAIIERAAEGLCVCHQVPEYPFVAFTVWNARMTEITGYTVEEINRLGWYQTVYPDAQVRDRAIERMARMRQGDDILGEEWEITRKDGAKRLLAISTSVIGHHESQVHVLALMHDVTERRMAEAESRRFEVRLQHAQKLESLGVLAGGIAHDFNNLLTVVLGNLELARGELSPVSPAHGSLLEAQKATLRAADLCKQMLAYSGKGRFIVLKLDLNEVVREMAHLLEVSVSKKTLLKYSLTAPLPAIEGDPTQIRQVVMNLITNASEALGEESGVVSVSTGVMRCDRAYLESGHPAGVAVLSEPLVEDRYVYLEVADTGCGMDAATLARVFEPFFTTKFTGRGLGLSAVLGILRGHKGTIRVYSEAGKGSSFKVLFPAAQPSSAPPSAAAGPTARPETWRGQGTILVADDEPGVRSLARRALEALGFAVLTAADGEDALAVFRAHAGQITCVLLDLTMPRLNGEQVFGELRRIRADVKVILCSGYHEQDVTQRFIGRGLAGFLQKPYDPSALQQKLQEVLGG